MGYNPEDMNNPAGQVAAQTGESTAMPSALEIRNLHVSVEDKPILKGVDLTVKQGEIHALMGPNGTGKSTLAYTLMGHPNYQVTAGQIIFKGVDLLELEPDERARLGLFLAFQYPVAIPGVSVANFLRTALNARRRATNPDDKGIPIPEFRKLLRAKMDVLKIPQDFAGRYLNEGFSGGEKKRAEILQMATLEPEIAILDETDSGLDIDALRIVASGVNAAGRAAPGRAGDYALQRILNYIKPDLVHIMLGGRIVETGGADLALHLEEKGYDWVREKHVEVAMAEKDAVPSTKENYADQYGFHDDENYVFKAERGLNPDDVRDMSKMKGEPDWMLRVPAEGARHLPQEADAQLGRGPERH